MHVLISSKFPTDEKIYGRWYGEVVKYLLSKPCDATSIPRAHMKAERKKWTHKVVWCPHECGVILTGTYKSHTQY